MFIDACRNDPSAGGVAEAFGELTRSRGIAILNAAEPLHYSFEDEQKKHGVFSGFVIEGLAGKAASENGLVTFAGLSDYVTRQMERDSKATGRQQRPYQTFDGFGDFYLSGRIVEPEGLPKTS